MTQIVVMGFVMILLGVILVAIIAENTQPLTTLTSVSETVNIAGARAYDSVNDDVNASFRFHLTQGCQESTQWKRDLTGTCQKLALITNASGATLVANTDYAANDTNIRCTGQSSGDLRFLNSTGMIASMTSGLNDTTVTYGVCSSGGYLTEGWSRQIMNLVPGFFVLGILAAGIWVAYALLNEANSPDN